MKHTRTIAILAGALFFAGGIDGHTPPSNRYEHVVQAVLWYQRSAEAAALYHQAFNIARLRLDEDHAKNRSATKRAVVVDIDETVLDNSPYSASLIKNDKSGQSTWDEWVRRAQAEPLPGAVEFLSYAVSRGYDVYYVSNRSAKTEFDATVRNLKTRGFPQVTADHVLLKEDDPSKQARRVSIEATHDIVLLMGDNLNDLSTVFEKKSPADRRKEVEKRKVEFGRRFIVLPNPVYGDWENAIYGYRTGLTDEQKDELRKAALQAF